MQVFTCLGSCPLLDNNLHLLETLFQPSTGLRLFAVPTVNSRYVVPFHWNYYSYFFGSGEQKAIQAMELILCILFDQYRIANERACSKYISLLSFAPKNDASKNAAFEMAQESIRISFLLQLQKAWWFIESWVNFHSLNFCLYSVCILAYWYCNKYPCALLLWTNMRQIFSFVEKV